MSDTTPAVTSAPVTNTLLTEPATTPEGATTDAPPATAPASADAPADPKAAPSETAAPVEYAFLAPEGVELDTALLEQVTPLFAESNLSPDAAQKLVSAYAAHVAAQDAARADAHAAQVQGWADEVRADPVIGGVHLKATLEHAHRALHRFGDAEVRADFEASGLGNKASFVRLLAKIGAQTSEDTTIRGSSGGTPAPTRSAGDRIYTTMNTKKE